MFPFLMISIQLVIIVSANHLECPSELTRLISTSDATNYSIEHGDSLDYAMLISLNPNLGDGYFRGTVVPNTGSFTFTETFLLLGLTTGGYRIGDNNYLVKSFTLRYANTIGANYQNYSTVFSVNSIDEVYFPFEEPLLVRKIELTTLTFETSSFAYYWKLNLLGCKETDVSEIMTSICPILSSTLSSTVSLTPGSISPSVTSQTESAAIPQTSLPSTVVTMTISSTTTVSTATVTQTVTSSCTTSMTTQQLDAQVSNSCAGPITAAVILPIILTMLFSILITVIFIWIYRKNSAPTSRDRSDTLKAVNNAQLYTSQDMNQSEGHYDLVKKDDDSDMMVNETYLCSSGQMLIQDGSSQLPPDDNEYSAIDHYYPSTTSNASSNKYEYITPPAAVDTSVIDDVESTPNPSYSAI